MTLSFWTELSGKSWVQKFTDSLKIAFETPSFQASYWSVNEAVELFDEDVFCHVEISDEHVQLRPDVDSRIQRRFSEAFGKTWRTDTKV